MSAVSRVLTGGTAAIMSLGAGLAAPSAAMAAPAPCERALPYAAESGASIFQLGTFDPRPAGGSGAATHDVGLGQSKTAMVGDATVNSAAVARLLDAAGAGPAGAPGAEAAPPAPAAGANPPGTPPPAGP